MTKLYMATFDTKKNGFQSWRIDIEANSIKEARQILEDRYTSSAHKFHVNVRLLHPDEEFLYHWFVRI